MMEGLGVGCCQESYDSWQKEAVRQAAAYGLNEEQMAFLVQEIDGEPAFNGYQMWSICAGFLAGWTIGEVARTYVPDALKEEFYEENSSYVGSAAHFEAVHPDRVRRFLGETGKVVLEVECRGGGSELVLEELAGLICGEYDWDEEDRLVSA